LRTVAALKSLVPCGNVGFIPQPLKGLFKLFRL
jgi:hypothetical protein